MKRIWRKLVCGALAAMMLLTLAACGGGDLDARLYIQGMMDLYYQNTYDKDYLEMMSLTEKEAAEWYLEGLEVEYDDYFSYCFEIDNDYVTDELREEYIDLLNDIYSHSKYTVKDAGKSGDAYRIEVIIAPVDVIKKVMEEDYDAFFDDFAARYASYTAEKINAMSASEREDFWYACEEDWGHGIIELCRARLETVGHLTEESVIVQVKPDPTDGYYTISDTDFSTIDNLILAY